ncbi:MAG TPA: GNAT family N-acetyltransferase [Aeromicrobium sp.]|nr:GNAT family N-acetyltransferase [Aeromicrobium sp.]
MNAADVRLVFTAEDTTVAADLLDAFNREFDTPTPGPDAIATRLATLLGEQTTFALVVALPDSGDIVGIALVTLRTNVWCQGWVGLLDELYVVPEHRNRGLGTALLRAAEAELVARGGELLEIGVDGEDVDAQRFYERHGYVDHDEWCDLPSKMYFRELAS